MDRICLRLVQGESLRKICADPEMPSLTTIWNWYRREDIKEDFLKQFLRARAFQSLVMDGDMQDVADDGGRDYVTETRGEEEVEVVDHEHIQRSKLRCEVLWRRMKCMNPEMFAEKLNVSHQGEVALVDRRKQLEEAKQRVEQARRQRGEDTPH